MNKLRAKNPQYTIANKKTPSLPYSWEKNFRDQFRIKGANEYSNDSLEYLAVLMMQWVKHSPDLYIFKVFLNYQNIRKSSLDEWGKRCPKLKEATLLARQIIATNRELNALAKDPSGKAFTHMQGTSDPEWKSQEQYFSQLKATADKNSTSNLTAVLLDSNEFERRNDASEAKRKGVNSFGQVPAKALSDSDNKS